MMAIRTRRRQSVYFLGASLAALVAAPQAVFAQEVISTDAGETEEVDEAISYEGAIVVTGIRRSLQEAINIKRNGQGVVDAISAEDIGKFPDTNLAESLQRITGVSIDRNNGEGSSVTVRGFGPEFNLVLLNGRQMPTSSLGDGASPPSSRSFDFANLAAEGVAAVEVYKTGRATVPSGGIGSTINIRTPRPLDRPGLHGSFAVKGVYDTSWNDGTEITPEVSGIVSSTFLDDRLGIVLNGVYQNRKASTNQANIGWRDAYLGSENNWGSLPMEGDPRFDDIINRPGPDDVYAVPQNGSYDFTNFERERINGQAVLQYQPTDRLTATLDYTFSQNTIEARTSSVGVWFNHVDTASAWTDGPVAGPIFYSESFNPGNGGYTDLAYSQALAANRSINKSLGFNVEWEAFDRFTLTADYHDSSAESKPTNRFGSSTSVGTAVFGVAQQTIDFDQYLPVISYQNAPGIDANDPSQRFATGNSFRNAYFRNDIEQLQLRAHFDADLGWIEGLDFGVTYTDNNVRSAYGFIQNDTWGGAGPASDIPDDIFYPITVPDKFEGLDGANDPSIIQEFYGFDFEDTVDLLDGLYGICGGDGNCLAPYTIDRRIREQTWAPFVEATSEFSIEGNVGHINAGLRYEKTDIDSSALVPIPNGTQWVSVNEFVLTYAPDADFTSLQGDYDYFLPALDIDLEVTNGVVLRGSYSHTITRPTYNNLQGGRTVDQLFRIGGGTGSQGNPGLLPFKSENFDFSAEYYFAPTSYVSVGYFRKYVENFIGENRIDQPIDSLTNPAFGPRADAAYAALGQDANLAEVRQYIFDNFPESTMATGVDASGNTTGIIYGLPDDAPVDFQLALPVNSDQTAKLDGFEVALQHTFGETGFGFIVNYTVVNGDARYDNTQPFSVTQFALTGLSDSANAVVFYDKGPFQARAAYNWRDEFLAGTGPNPFYVEAYGQVDASASYEFDMGITAFVEAINLTNESRRGHRRADNTAYFAGPGYARYTAGVRYTF